MLSKYKVTQAREDMVALNKPSPIAGGRQLKHKMGLKILV